MKFSQIIKKLRLEADMTQEKLSELLSISPQAVSRWETDMAMPDISLLPPLANLFHVTTDYLLGMDTYEKDKRREAFEKAYKDYWKTDDKEQGYRIALQAATEYPDDMKYKEWLAASEYYLGLTDTTDACKMLEKAVQHYKIVLENCSDKIVWEKAQSGIVMALFYSGKKAEAKEYAMLQEDEDKRDELLNWCLEGEEKRMHSQKLIDRKLKALCFQLVYQGEKRIEAYEAVENILNAMIPDGNYLDYHGILQYNYIHKAFVLCHTKCYDDAIKELKKARYHAEKMIEVRMHKNYQFTTPLLDCLIAEFEDGDSSCTDLADFCACLQNNSCFDPIRDRTDFIAINSLEMD